MAIVQQAIIPITDGTYGMSNTVIGAIKTMLTASPLVATISDNDPANNVARIWVFSIASQAHYHRLTATASTITFELLKLDQSTTLQAAASLSVANASSIVAKLLYNAEAVAFRFGSTISSYTIDCGDPVRGWYIRGYNTSNLYVYFNNSDTNGAATVQTTSFAQGDGTHVLIPARFYISSTLLEYYHPYVYTASASFPALDTIYTDGTYQYLNQNAVTGYWIIADRVPA